jgi:hypothetical protein
LASSVLVISSQHQGGVIGAFHPNLTAGAIGTIDYNITTPSASLLLVVYLDTDDSGPGGGSWDQVYSKYRSGNYTCEELVSMHRGKGHKGNYSIVSGLPGRITDGVTSLLVLPDLSSVDHIHPYYWFVAVADCERSEGLELESYHLEFLNPVPHNSEVLISLIVL